MRIRWFAVAWAQQFERETGSSWDVRLHEGIDVVHDFDQVNDAVVTIHLNQDGLRKCQIKNDYNAERTCLMCGGQDAPSHLRVRMDLEVRSCSDRRSQSYSAQISYLCDHIYNFREWLDFLQERASSIWRGPNIMYYSSRSVGGALNWFDQWLHRPHTIKRIRSLGNTFFYIQFDGGGFIGNSHNRKFEDCLCFALMLVGVMFA